jgi:hypothetical protein
MTHLNTEHHSNTERHLNISHPIHKAHRTLNHTTLTALRTVQPHIHNNPPTALLHNHHTHPLTAESSTKSLTAMELLLNHSTNNILALQVTDNQAPLNTELLQALEICLSHIMVISRVCTMLSILVDFMEIKEDRHQCLWELTQSMDSSTDLRSMVDHLKAVMVVSNNREGGNLNVNGS